MESEIWLDIFVTGSNAPTRPKVCTDEQIYGGTPTTTIVVQSLRSLSVETPWSSAAGKVLVTAEHTEAESAVVGNGIIGEIRSIPTRGSAYRQKAIPRPAQRTLSEQARSELNAPRREIEKATPQSLLAGP